MQIPGSAPVSRQSSAKAGYLDCGVRRDVVTAADYIADGR